MARGSHRTRYLPLTPGETCVGEVSNVLLDSITETEHILRKRPSTLFTSPVSFADFLFRLLFFSLAPFAIVLAAELFPVSGTLLDVALALGVFVAGEAARSWPPTFVRSIGSYPKRSRLNIITASERHVRSPTT